MSPRRWIAVALFLTLVSTAGAALAQEELVPICAESLAVHLPWGIGPGMCASGDRSTPGGFPGPLFEVSGGSIYLYDRVAGILSVFDRAGAQARRDSLPAMLGISCHEISDLRVYRNAVYFLAIRDRLPIVLVYDLASGETADLPVSVAGEMAPPDAEAAEAYKLIVADDGLHLFQRLAQAAVLVDNGVPVPVTRQVARPGLPVGKERINYVLPSGAISTVEGHVVASGMLRASGSGRVMVVLRRGGREKAELVDMAKGRITSTLVPSRPRGPAAMSGTRYRIEPDAYYELHVEDSGVKIFKWLCPGLM